MSVREGLEFGITFQKPDIVLGQVGKVATGRNAKGEVSASSLFYPSGIWSNGKKLILSDAVFL